MTPSELELGVSGKGGPMTPSEIELGVSGAGG